MSKPRQRQSKSNLDKVRVECFITHEMHAAFILAAKRWSGPKEGGNPTRGGFIAEAIAEKIEREKQKGPQ